MSVGRLIERGLIGGLFIGHGTQKLFGWFGGPGREGTEGMMHALQMHPAKANALAAGVTETAGGAAVVLGLGTPAAAAALTGVMTTAVQKVHLANGPWASNGGWEYNAVLIAALAALAETGPGDLSLDHALGLDDLRGPAWALGAVAVGVATAFLTMELGRRNAPAPAPAAGTAGDALDEDRAGDPATAGS
jgi:putative oxidoreductase